MASCAREAVVGRMTWSRWKYLSLGWEATGYRELCELGQLTLLESQAAHQD